jgi:beta-galactosidase
MRERLSLDRNWRFSLGHAADASRDFDFVRDRSLVKAGEARGAAGREFDDCKWRVVNIPHDWAIELPLDPKGDKELCDHGFVAIGPDHPEHSVGWYRRKFRIPKSDLGRRISIEFDGVFRDSIVWVNGFRMGRHEGGYTDFRYDVTDVLNYGGENVVAVRVDASCYEGWWYEGAGIYRHVWLVKTPPLHVAPNGTFVTAMVCGERAKIAIATKIVNDNDDTTDIVVESEFRGMGASPMRRQRPKRTGEAPVPRAARTRVHLDPWSATEVEHSITIQRPRLWSCNEPNLYQLITTLRVGDRSVDRYETTFGIRSIRWDAKRGFFLNNKPLKIKGTCNHQHFAGVGIALPDRLHVARLEKLKAMGSNAYRCSHYPVAPELLDACDRLGILVLAENRVAGSSPEALDQFRGMIVRDRNHPSIIGWSIANEEHTIQWAVAGERIGRTMVRIAHELDPTRIVTAAMHDRGLDEGFANIVDVHGWNYIKVGDIEKFHRRNPKRPIVGTEEGSTVCTRGIYADDAKRGYVSAYDLRTPKWGSTAEHWWSFFAERPWLAGGFVWTGFDYLGEPIPYKWPCTASHFGLMDLCGFPKDNYWYYRAWWGEEPVLHLLPHWNWPGREGQEIDVRAFSNCEQVELWLNGRSVGRQRMNRNAHIAWNVPYEPGLLEARGYRSGNEVARATVRTSGKVAHLVISADRGSIDADGEDVALLRVSAVDSNGAFVPTAKTVVEFDIAGAGKLIGVGNGDPSSHEPHKASRRSLFNGLALAIVQSEERAGKIAVKASSPGLQSATMVIRSRPVPANRRRPRAI